MRDTSAINNFGNQITHVFFDNSLVGMINGSSFTDNNSTDFYKDDIFTTKWSEMKRFYDDKGREVKFKVVRDLGNKNDREPVITIGYIKNSLIELIDPFVSEEGASESCDGSMYCTLENFIETDEYKDANQAELEPLSKMECKGGYDSVDYLCLASSTSDWNFTNYSEKCVKTETFKTELNNGTSGNTDVLTELLKLPLESEGKTTHLYQWCMPKYEFNGVLYNREICEINKKVIIDDNNYTCELCEGNSVPDETKETCVECEEGKIADPSDGTCKDAEEIVVPPETDDKCTKGVEIIISNTCSCPSGSKRVENSDKSKFMCLSCEEGFEPNPDDFGKCISTTDLELIRKMKECLKLAPLMEWKDNVCVFTNKATTLTCPSNAFIVTDRNKDCVCADGTSPVIDSINGSGQCGKTDLNVVNKNEGGGCSIGSDKVNSILPLFFTFILLISKKRKYFRL